MQVLRLITLFALVSYIYLLINYNNLSWLHYLRNLIFFFIAISVLHPLIIWLIGKRNKMMRNEDLEQIIKQLGGKNIPVYMTRQKLSKNAFVIYSLKRPIIIVGKELVELLDYDQLKFVLAHEYAHIKYSDLIKNMYSWVIAVCLIPIILLSLPLIKLPLSLSISIILIIYLSGIMIHFYISKQREHRADAFAAEVFGKENAINALSKLKKTSLVPEKSFSLFEVHPKLDLRIKNVKEKVK
ncbi:M48 family metalloprotease [Bacillus subtilis]|nr:M48 family metalloprotease [Bacillus subtilis]